MKPIYLVEWYDSYGASSAGVADLTNAEFSVRVLKDSKELFPVFDESAGLRNIAKDSYLNFENKTSYLMGYVEVHKEIEVLKTYTFQTFAKTKGGQRVRVYLNRGYGYNVFFSENQNGVEKRTLTPILVWNEYGTGLGLFNDPSSGADANPASVEWIAIYEGDVEPPSYWLPAPEELLSNATITSHNCDYEIDGRKIKLKGIDDNVNNGYVDVEVSYGEGYTAKRRFTWAKVKEGAKGADGKAITDVDVEYAIGASSTVAPATTWNTTAPTWVDGMYIWSRTKTFFSDGTSETTNPVCITGGKGATGSTGSAGRGITSITEQYYLSTSKTTQTGGSWVETPPTWEYGKYIWTRSKIVYNNPTSTAYTTPIVSSEWEAIEEVQVGGDNLAKQSDIYMDAGSNVNLYSIIKGINSIAPLPEDVLKNNTEYVLHIGKSEKIAGSATEFQIVIFDFVSNTDLQSNTYPFSSEKKIIHFKTPATGHWSLLIYAGVFSQTAGNIVKYSDVMLQEGNKATAFIPPMRYLTEAIQSKLDIEGGLLLGNVLGTKALTGEVKSYMSGLSSNPTAFAAGVQLFGTELETKNVDIKHDGSAVIGVLEVDNITGLVRVVSEGVTRFLITKSLLPTLQSLLSGAISSNGVEPSSFSHNTPTDGSTLLITNTLVLPENDNTLTFEGYGSVNCDTSLPPPWTGFQPMNGARIEVYIYRLEGGTYKPYSYIDMVNSNDGTVSKNINKSISNVPSGSYRVYLSYFLYPGGSLSLTAMTLSYTHSNDVRRIEYGKNGMMLFYNEAGNQNYLYMTNEGLSVGGKTDIPAGLGGASISNSGVISKNWGKIAGLGQVQKSGNNYTITHNIGDTDYSLILTPSSTNVPYFSSKNNNTIVVTCAGGFDFILIRTK